MEIKDYLDKFEEKLKDELIYLCTSYEMLNGNLLETIDVEQRWTDFSPEYVADAIKEIKDYPTVSVAWAAFIGAAVAYYWDKDTTMFGACKYKSFYGPNGFDDMDEYILYKILHLTPEDKEAKDLENMIRRCGEKTVSMIRHEQIEPQSPIAFHVFARAIKVMYRIGAALELKRLGYKLELVNLPNC